MFQSHHCNYYSIFIRHKNDVCRCHFWSISQKVKNIYWLPHWINFRQSFSPIAMFTESWCCRAYSYAHRVLVLPCIFTLIFNLVHQFTSSLHPCSLGLLCLPHFDPISSVSCYWLSSDIHDQADGKVSIYWFGHSTRDPGIPNNSYYSSALYIKIENIPVFYI